MLADRGGLAEVRQRERHPRKWDRLTADGHLEARGCQEATELAEQCCSEQICQRHLAISDQSSTGSQIGKGVHLELRE